MKLSRHRVRRGRQPVVRHSDVLVQTAFVVLSAPQTRDGACQYGDCGKRDTTLRARKVDLVPYAKSSSILAENLAFISDAVAAICPASFFKCHSITSITWPPPTDP
eukprot:2379653-Rhodomonas_salina.3